MPGARGILGRSFVAALLLPWVALAQETVTPAPAVAEGHAEASGAKLDSEGYKACTEECEERRELTDLTPLNFFTEGWGQAWSHRHRHTPDMSLLRVTTNFLEREFRIDYVFTAVNNNPKVFDTQSLQGLIAYGLNRRLMLELITNYQWNVPPNNGVPVNGP